MQLRELSRELAVPLQPHALFLLKQSVELAVHLQPHALFLLKKIFIYILFFIF